jgi:GST-like protein
MAKMRLFGEPGWGSVIVEAQLDWYGLPYDFERVGDLFKSTEGKPTEGQSAEARQRLAAVNPLAQIPTLVLANGDVLTESAAITLWLAEQQGADSLVPRAGDALRAPFLRWLVYLVANVYPTYTYGDDPARFVDGEDAQRSFREHVSAHRNKVYALLETVAGAPWFLGARFSALDLYVCAMTRWRPGREWFAANAPKLAAIAARTEQVPELAACWRRNAVGG